MATEYIKREDALNVIRKSPISNMGTRLFCIDAIADIPAADVVERKHGEWIKADEGFDGSWVCSECMEEYVSVDADFIDYAHYCPNCGAQMEREDN